MRNKSAETRLQKGKGTPPHIPMCARARALLVSIASGGCDGGFRPRAVGAA